MPMTAVQYDMAVKAAEKRTVNQIGKRPERRDFSLEFSPLINPLDPFLFLLFAAAFAVSATHILRAMGHLVSSSIKHVYQGGIQIDTSLEIGLSQIASLAMNETALIVFMVMFNFRMHQRRNSKSRTIDQTMLDYAPMIGVVIATVYIFWANLQSGLGLLSLIAPIFTAIGSIRLEEIASEKIKRNDTITARYTVALSDYERNTMNIRGHENFKKNLYESVFESCCRRNKKNLPYMPDCEFDEKIAIVQSEIERHETWMDANITPKQRKKKDVVKVTKQPQNRSTQNGSMNTVYEFMLSHPDMNPKVNSEFTYAKAAEAVSGKLGYSVSIGTIHKVAARIAQNGNGK